MARMICEFKAVLVNAEALEALGDAAELIREAADDAPWSDQLREALKKLEYVALHLDVVGV